MTAHLAVWCDRCGLELVVAAARVATCGCPRCGARHVDVCEIPAETATRRLLRLVSRRMDPENLLALR